jgi:hypothetical protein
MIREPGPEPFPFRSGKKPETSYLPFAAIASTAAVERLGQVVFRGVVVEPNLLVRLDGFQRDELSAANHGIRFAAVVHEAPVELVHDLFESITSGKIHVQSMANLH